MTTIIKSIDRTITPKEIIPLLNKYGMLSRLVSEDIIDRAIAEIECTPQEIAIASKLWQHRQSKSKTALGEIASAIRKLKIEKFKQQTWGDGIPAYFTRRKKQLDRVVYSIVKIKSTEIAREIYFRLIEGEQTFTELTQEYAEHPLVKVSEALGWIELGTVPSSIAQQLSSMKIDTISAPILIENCYAILRLDKYVSAQCDRLMEKRLINELFDRWMQQQLTQQKYHLVNFDSLK